MEVLILVLALAAGVFNVWLFIVGVQFLRIGTQAFKAYLAEQHRRARATGAVVSPPQPEQRPWTGR